MLQIRKGDKNDVEPICKLLIKTWLDSYSNFIPAKFLNNLSLDRQIQRHSKYMDRLATYYVVEDDNKEIIGFASYGKNRIESIQGEQELYTIYIKMNFQGAGIGKQLLNMVLNDLKDSEAIAVSVFKQNPFKRFYVKNRFKKIDEEIVEMDDFNLITEISLRSL